MSELLRKFGNRSGLVGSAAFFLAIYEHRNTNNGFIFILADIVFMFGFALYWALIACENDKDDAFVFAQCKECGCRGVVKNLPLTPPSGWTIINAGYTFYCQKCGKTKQQLNG